MAHAYTRFLTHWNFDIGEPQFEDGKPNLTDLGNVAGSIREPERMVEDAAAILGPLVKSASCLL